MDNAVPAKPFATSAEHFVTQSPLFTEIVVNGFYPPQRISFECDGECGKETTWQLLHEAECLGGVNKPDEKHVIPDTDLYSMAYTCWRCKKSLLTVVYRELEKEQRPIQLSNPMPPIPGRGIPPPAAVRYQTITVKVMKVGQYPKPTIYLPPRLKASLGTDAVELYRKALMCRNNGFGLAAVAYMRRVVEDKTNELIELAAQQAEAQNANAETVAKIRAAGDSKVYTSYEKKLACAATVFPENLEVSGINPLETLYGLVSEGLHGLSEPECIGVADKIKTIFEYVFENLKAQLDERRAFETKLKQLA